MKKERGAPTLMLYADCGYAGAPPHPVSMAVGCSKMGNLKMSVEGISHITILVKDLERCANFLTSVFDTDQVYSCDNQQFSSSREKFFIIGGIWLALMEGLSLPERNYNHIAFNIPSSESADIK